MKNLTLQGRYGLKYPCTYNKNGKYYFIDTREASYVTVHYDGKTSKTILGIDPEGLYIISVGAHFNEGIIEKIMPTENGYNIYIKEEI